MQTRRLVLCALPFGYGPAAKVLAIARAVRALGVSTAFVGSGIALELIGRSADVFDDVVAVPPSHPTARSLVASSAAVVSMMDRDASRLARECGKRLYVVDSLLWMRDRIPEPFRHASRYWTQRFFGKEIGSWRLSPPPTVVAPIVAPIATVRSVPRVDLLIHLGGCASPTATAEDHYRYAAFITRAIVSAELPVLGRTLLLAGESCAERLRGEFPGCGIEFDSLPHEDALGALANSGFVLTSPGVTATLECFRLGVATFFLPPQNYSQWLALGALRDACLAPEAFHWADVVSPPSFRDMPEDRRTPAVLHTIRCLSAQMVIQQDLERRLRRMLRRSRTDLAAMQHEAFVSLGSNGTAQIARELASDLAVETVCAGETPMEAS